MAVIGSLVVEISAKDKLTAALSNAASKISSFVSNVASSMLSISKYIAGGIAAAVGTIAYLILSTTTKIADLADEASRFSMPVEELQKFQYAASLAGVSAEGLNTSLQFMLKNVSEAATGTGAASDAFKRLGLDAGVLSSLSTADQFKQIADAMNRVSNNGDRVALAMQIFGRSGSQILNIFKDDIRKTSAEFDALGLALTAPQAKAVKAFDDARTKIGAIWGGFKEQVTAAVAPAFEAIYNYIIETIKRFGGIRGVALQAGQSILSGMLFAVRGLEGLIKSIGEFLNELSAGVNKTIILFETLAITALKAAKVLTPKRVDDYSKGIGSKEFWVGKVNPEQSVFDDQIKMLTDDKTMRQQGKKAGTALGDGFIEGSSKVKTVADELAAQIDKLNSKSAGPGAAGGFGSITRESTGEIFSAGDKSAEAAAKLEASMAENKAVIAKFEQIASASTAARKGTEQMITQFDAAGKISGFQGAGQGIAVGVGPNGERTFTGDRALGTGGGAGITGEGKSMALAAEQKPPLSIIIELTGSGDPIIQALLPALKASLGPSSLGDYFLQSALKGTDDTARTVAK